MVNSVTSETLVAGSNLAEASFLFLFFFFLSAHVFIIFRCPWTLEFVEVRIFFYDDFTLFFIFYDKN